MLIIKNGYFAHFSTLKCRWHRTEFVTNNCDCVITLYYQSYIVYQQKCSTLKSDTITKTGKENALKH